MLAFRIFETVKTWIIQGSQMYGPNLVHSYPVFGVLRGKLVFLNSNWGIFCNSIAY